MEITLTFFNQIRDQFRAFFEVNKSDINDMFTKWNYDEKIKGVSLQHYLVIDNFVGFFYPILKDIELSFGTVWNATITQDRKPLIYNGKDYSKPPFILTIDVDQIPINYEGSNAGQSDNIIIISDDASSN